MEDHLSKGKLNLKCNTYTSETNGEKNTGKNLTLECTNIGNSSINVLECYAILKNNEKYKIDNSELPKYLTPTKSISIYIQDFHKIEEKFEYIIVNDSYDNTHKITKNEIEKSHIIINRKPI